MVPAVVKAIRILQYLARQGDRGASLVQIYRALGINKSTCYNILKTLEHFNLVDYLSVFKIYRTGYPISDIGRLA